MASSSPLLCGDIHIAIGAGDLDGVNALLKENPTLVSSQEKDGWTPLHMAAFKANKDAVALLLSVSKPEVNAKDNDGEAPLELMTTQTSLIGSVNYGMGAVQRQSMPKIRLLSLALRKGRKGTTELVRQNGGVVSGSSTSGPKNSQTTTPQPALPPSRK